MRAVVYHQYGVASEVAHLEERELSGLKTGQVQVAMLFAPINPADLNMIGGKYAIRPALPSVPGVEGVGRVEALGPGVECVAVGDTVLLPHAVGTWCQACAVAADQLVVVPFGIPPEQAAMLRVNPATALRMLRDFVDLNPGDWVLQNGANSAVGRGVIQIAKTYGWRTVNVVRRPEVIEELKALGADVVLVEGDSLREQIREATGSAPIALALNCVGGESALRLSGALAASGTLVTYGAMGMQPLRIPNGMLIFKDLRFRGFWVTQWYEQASEEARRALFAELFDLARRGVIHSPIERIYPLSEFTAAVERAQQHRRTGKILLDLSA